MPDSPDTNMTPDRLNIDRSSSTEQAREALVHEIEQGIDAILYFETDPEGNLMNEKGSGIRGQKVNQYDAAMNVVEKIRERTISADRKGASGKIIVGVAGLAELGGDRLHLAEYPISEPKAFIHLAYPKDDGGRQHFVLETSSGTKNSFVDFCQTFGLRQGVQAISDNAIELPNEPGADFKGFSYSSKPKEILSDEPVSQKENMPRSSESKNNPDSTHENTGTWADWLKAGEDEYQEVDFQELDKLIARYSKLHSVGAVEESRLIKLYNMLFDMSGEPAYDQQQRAKAAFYLERVANRMQQREAGEVGGDKQHLAKLRQIEERRERREVGGYADLIARIDDLLSTELPKIDTETENFFEDPPEWYKALDDKDRKMVRAYFTMSYLAGKKLRSGAEDTLDNSISPEGFQMDRRQWGQMWENMPGFRQATATLVKDLCKLDGNGRLVLTEEAIKNKLNGGRDVYLDGLSDKLRSLFSRQPRLIDHPDVFLPVSADATTEEKIDIAVKQAVQSAWSLFYMGGVIESANRNFDLRSGPEFQQLSLLQLYHPREWLSFRLKVDQPDKYSLVWGGGLGEWHRFEYINNMDFRLDYQNGRNKFIPDTMAMSWFDYIQYGEGKYSKGKPSRTFGQVLLGFSREVTGVSGLYEAVDTDANMANLGNIDDIWFKYGSTTGQVRKLYDTLSGATELEKRDAIKTADAWKAVYEDARFAADPYLREMYTSDDFVLALTVVSAGEPLIGSPELIPDIDTSIYSEKIYRVTSKFNEIFAAMDGGSRQARERILKRLHAQDMTKAGIFSFIPWDDLPTSRVKKLRNQAVKRTAEVSNLRKKKKRSGPTY